MGSLILDLLFKALNLWDLQVGVGGGGGGGAVFFPFMDNFVETLITFLPLPLF